ncbi:hypothetical protein PMW_20 [Pseudomonas phage phiPMW]|uniref:Uncharacterized protein n=1 Tax=Pseudomonas phage phiPMW TaxID=1815582 RepID=A0A1S5R156_9CAUD|nr:hypothetical protein FDG97_gp020 [Pseudomonas phage phiPMW]ANA49145.1 hypothetical protein PMW_20 [Pseudomonas phage phiPMW]
MSVFDVRTNTESPITEIRFADPESANGTTQADRLVQSEAYAGCVALCDSDYDPDYDNAGMVLLTSREQAQSLALALQKAIELGWLK